MVGYGHGEADRESRDIGRGLSCPAGQTVGSRHPVFERDPHRFGPAFHALARGVNPTAAIRRKDNGLTFLICPSGGPCGRAGATLRPLPG